MSLTRSRLEQAHSGIGKAGGMIALAISRKKLSRMEVQNAIFQLRTSISMLESILSVED